MQTVPDFPAVEQTMGGQAKTQCLYHDGAKSSWPAPSIGQALAQWRWSSLMQQSR